MPQNNQAQDILVVGTRPTHKRFIQLTTTSYAHIFTQHVWFPFPYTSRFAQEFRNVTKIYDLVGQTIMGGTGVVQPNGRVRYTTNLGFIVGTGQNGFDTTMMTVIVQPTGPDTGDVLTAYPGG